MISELVKMCAIPAIMIGGVLYGATPSDAAAAAAAAATARPAVARATTSTPPSPAPLGLQVAGGPPAALLDAHGAALSLTTSCDDIVCDQLCGEAGACEGGCNPLGRCYCVWPYPSGECP